jgi:hypothetical protein
MGLLAVWLLGFGGGLVLVMRRLRVLEQSAQVARLVQRR